MVLPPPVFQYIWVLSTATRSGSPPASDDRLWVAAVEIGLIDRPRAVEAPDVAPGRWTAGSRSRFRAPHRAPLIRSASTGGASGDLNSGPSSPTKTCRALSRKTRRHPRRMSLPAMRRPKQDRSGGRRANSRIQVDRATSASASDARAQPPGSCRRARRRAPPPLVVGRRRPHQLRNSRTCRTCGHR